MVQRTDTPEPVPLALALLEGPNLIIEWANDHTYRMAAQFTDAEIIGHSIGEYLPIKESAEVERALNNCADTGEPSHVSGEIVGPMGVMAVRASIYRLPGGKILVTAWHPILQPIAEKDGPVGTVRAGDEVPDRS